MLRVAKYLCFLFSITLISCSNILSVDKKNKSKEYQIERFRSEVEGEHLSTYISLENYEYGNKKYKIGGVYWVNNIGFIADKFPHILSLMPGIFTVESGSIGYLNSKIENLKINRGDSIVVKFYLKADPEPLH